MPLSEAEKHVINTLITLTNETDMALEDSEELSNGNYVIEADGVKSIIKALKTLDDLPEDQPGVIMSSCGKAEWALRGLLDPEVPNLLDELKKLYKGYVNTLESGRDRLADRGYDCDPVDVMEAGDPALVRARWVIAMATLKASP